MTIAIRLNLILCKEQNKFDLPPSTYQGVPLMQSENISSDRNIDLRVSDRSRDIYYRDEN